MRSTSFRDADIFVNVGHDGDRFFPSDDAGAELRLVDPIGGPFGTEIRWHIANRTEFEIRIRIDGFRQGGADKCPIEGGDFQNCEFESLQAVPRAGAVVISTAIIQEGDHGTYDYDLRISRWDDPGPGDPIDPELQIDM